MKELTIEIKSVYQKGQFHGMVHYDDGTTSIAKRYKNPDEFLAAVEEVYDMKLEAEGGEDVAES